MKVVVTTLVTACSPEFYYHFNSNIIIVDKARRLSRAEYLMLIGHFDTKQFMLLGDRNQLDPVVFGPPILLGFLSNLNMSVLTWCAPTLAVASSLTVTTLTVTHSCCYLLYHCR